jgi:ATP-dependent Clp protease ATP-binding subunit ClpA
MQAHKNGSVVLLDEVEKAHPEVLDLFLPCFGECHLSQNEAWISHWQLITVEHQRRADTTSLKLGADEGYLTDARGVRHECKQTVFIMTSNLGTPQLHEAILAQQAALDAGDIGSEEVALDSDAVEEIVEPVIQSRLRPELLGVSTSTADAAQRQE